MVSTGSNAVQVGSFNQAVVLDVIRRSDKISRVEIAKMTGLSSQTVTNIARRMLDQGLVIEAGKTSVKLGKPRTLMQLNPAGGYAIGVHLDPSFTSVALLDLTGQIVHHQRFATPSAADPENVIEVIAGALAGVISLTGVDKAKILGIGIGAPGPVDLEAGIVMSPPHLPRWHRVALRDELAKVTGLPVILEKDVIVAAVAERWNARSSTNSAVVIYVGTGIGVGSISNGIIIRGTSGNSGDVAHIIIDNGPDAELCSCGRRGCVTVTASPTALITRARAAGIDLPKENDAAALTELFRLEASGDQVAHSLISTAVAGLAHMALVVTDLYDPDRLIFGGPFWSRYRDAFNRQTRKMLESAPTASPIHSVEISESTLGDEMGAMGAGIIVLDRFLTPNAGNLTLEGSQVQ